MPSNSRLLLKATLPVFFPLERCQNGGCVKSMVKSAIMISRHMVKPPRQRTHTRVIQVKGEGVNTARYAFPTNTTLQLYRKT